VSGNCYKVRLLLAHLGYDYDRVEVDVVDRRNREQVLGELNPARRIPTLVLDGGRPLAESGAILCYLANGTPWLPTDPFVRAQVLQWMFFEQSSHAPFIGVARYWLTIAPEAPNPDALAAKQARGRGALHAMDRHLEERPFLVGERPTIADLALYAYTHVAAEGGFNLGQYPAVVSWLERVASEPGHVRIAA
jgi:glutathione S-transferase